MSATQEKMERLLEGGNVDAARQVLEPSGSGRGAPEFTPKSNIAPPTTGDTAAPAPASEAPTAPKEIEEVEVVLPNGEEVILIVPKGMSEQDIHTKLVDMGEIDDGIRDQALERFMYEFSKADTITSNMGYWAKSHFPYLATEYTINDDGDIQILYPEDIYGPEIVNMSPQERREHMQAIDDQRRDEHFKGAKAEQRKMEKAAEMDIAGGAGMLTGVIADPVAAVPVAGQAGKTAMGVKEAAKFGAKAGALWGGAYGVSEQLAASGVPTTAQEGAETASRTLLGAGVGAIGGAALSPIVPITRIGYQKLTGNVKQSMLKTVEGRRTLGERYYERMWQEQIGGRSASEASNRARQALKLEPDDVTKLRDALWDDTGFYTAAWSPADAKRRMALKFDGDHVPIGKASRKKAAIDRIVRPIDSIINDIAPKVYTRLIKMESNLYRHQHRYWTETRDWVKVHRSMPADQRLAASKAMFNNNFSEARAIYRRHAGKAGLDAFNKMESSLRKLGDEMEANGIQFDRIQDYFPRYVRDRDALFDYLNKSRPEGLQKALRDAERSKGGAPLTANEEMKIINRFMEYGSPKGNMKSVKSAKERGIKELNDSMIKQFYADPITSIDLHIRDSIAAVERRKFFGKHLKVNELGIENVDDSVGSLLQGTDLAVNPRVTETLTDLLRARFGKGEQAGSRTLAGLRHTVGGLTLGNPYSAVRQLGDIPAVAYMNGVINTLKAVPIAVRSTYRGVRSGGKGGEMFNADTFGFMMEMAQELDTMGAGATGKITSKLRKTAEMLYKYGGFRLADRFGKNILMHSTRNRYRSMAKTPHGQQKIREQYSRFYQPDELNELIDDLANDRMTDLVKTHIVADVMKLQPVSRSQMPETYLNHPNARAMYQFRTWSLKQLDLVRTSIFRELASGDPKRMANGARGLGLYVLYLGAGNLGISQVQRMMTGRLDVVEDWEDIPNEALWAAVGNLGIIDRYSAEQFTKTGRGDAALLSFMPPALTIPTELVGNTYKYGKSLYQDDWQNLDKDQRNIIRTLGGVGRLYDWWFLGGAEEFNEKEERKRLFGDIRN